ncbi:amino acid adenylation domain-containing protein [Azospirillum argentinense]
MNQPTAQTIERTVETVIQDTFRLAVPISRHNSFSELGLDSIRQVRLLGELRKLWPHIRIRDLYKHSTIELLARSLAGDETVPSAGEAGTPPLPLSVARAVFEHAVRNPDSIAVEDSRGTLSYETLWRAAHSLSERLNSISYRSGRIVITVGKSRELIVAYLACLIAGRAFCPIDPAEPSARLERALTILDPDAIIGPAVPGGNPQLRITDADLQAVECGSGKLVEPPQDRPGEECYVFFTSGSTGTPKAVLGRRSSLSHFLAWELELLKLDSAARVSFLSAKTFDPSLRDIFAALLAGGTCCIPNDEDLLDPCSLAQWLEISRITTIHIVPTLFRTITPFFETQPFRALRHVLFAGEILRGSDVQAIAPRIQAGMTVFNLYGPTETTLAKVCHRVSAGDKDKAVIPVGRPLPDTWVQILDDSGFPASPGTLGRLVIETRYPSLGYIADLGVDTRHFREGKSSDVVQYDTGDLARMTDDGLVEVVGRNDGQVKINGRRVELAEIDSALLSMHGVANAISVVVQTAPKRTLLVAVIQAQGALNESDVKERLCSLLPEYMLPNRILSVPQLPTNKHGKIDRNAIRVWVEQSVQTAASGIASVVGKDLQRALAIIADVLGVEAGLLDGETSLAANGANSLLIGRLRARLNKEFGCRISLADLFKLKSLNAILPLVQPAGTQTVAGLAAAVDAPRGEAVSSIERRLIVAELISKVRGSYNVPNALELQGALDVEAFTRAIARVVASNPVLASRYTNSGGQYFAARSKDPISVPFMDVTQGTDDFDLDRALQDLAFEPFDLERTCARFHLYKTAETSFVFVYVFHHVACDARALDVFLDTLFACYNAGRDGQSSELQLRPYSDYRLYERSAAFARQADMNAEYWRQALAGFELKRLPSDNVSAEQAQGLYTFRRDTILNAAAKGSIERTARSLGVTPFTLFATAIQVLRHKYGCGLDTVIGITALNREEEFGDVIGCFVNTLPVRLKSDGQSGSCRNLIAENQGLIAQALSHQYLPVEKLGIASSYSGAGDALFDTILTYHSRRESPSIQFEKIYHPDLISCPMEIGRAFAKADLVFSIVEREDSFSMSIDFDEALYTPGLADQVLTHYVRCVESLVGQPDLAPNDVKLLSADEIGEQLAILNNLQSAFPESDTLLSIFLRVAGDHAEAVAISAGAARCTYETLSARAEAIRREITAKQLDAAAAHFVAIIADPGVDMIASVFSIFAANRGYLPIDPTSPLERIRFILDDSDTQTVLTTRKYAHLVPPDRAAVYFEDIGECAAPLQPQQGGSALDAAYMIYTSGTTGRPKGVVISHRNVVRLLFPENTLFDFGPADVWLLFHSFAFDFSVWEIFGALLFGGRLVVPSREDCRDPVRVIHMLVDEKVTILNQTPSAFYSLLGVLAGHDDLRRQMGRSHIRKVIFGGEALSPVRVAPWIQVLPDCELINMYGITETTVHVTYRKLDADALQSPRSSIGRPIPTLALAIVDEEFNIAPRGVAGEIIVVGDGVSEGYWKRPDLNAERFVTLPFYPGRRGYRSGDLARLHFNGELEFLGRKDHQIQLRGFRIELQEIESVVLSHPDIWEARVICRGQGEHANLVCCYTSDRELGAAALRDHIARQLPYYMLPGALVQVPAIPLTTNGKVDTAQLDRVVASDRLAPRQGTVWTPRAPQERVLHDALAASLGVQELYVDDNYFNLGGDSIKALTAVAKANGLLSIADIYRNPVMSGLIACISSASKTRRSITSFREQPSRPKFSVICVPYAGGESSDYFALSQALESRCPDAFLCVGNLQGSGHSRLPVSDDIEALYREWESAGALQKDVPTIVYGHCAGAGLACGFAHHLVARGYTIIATVVGATLPPSFASGDHPGNPWDTASADDICTYLESIGGIKGLEDADLRAAIVGNFTRDVAVYRRVFFDLRGGAGLPVPMFVILGDRDPSIDAKVDPNQAWRQYATNVTVTLLEKAGHYFNRDCAEELAELILGIGTGHLPAADTREPRVACAPCIAEASL